MLLNLTNLQMNIIISTKNIFGLPGETPEYFAEYKIRDLTRVEQIVGGEVNNILDFGTGVGNSIPFLA